MDCNNRHGPRDPLSSLAKMLNQATMYTLILPRVTLIDGQGL
jgi:hypothetical protein